MTDATEPRPTPCLEMAHVLFTDIVAYSTLHMDQQQQLLHQLQEAVRSTPSFVRAQAEDQLIRLPTGDGMALVFFRDPEAPVRCALELTEMLRKQPEIKLRMGIHSGPVYRVADINANRNVAGGGINLAQRVMDCGDAGHILVSSAEAEVLGQVSAWSRVLHDLGDVEVKHGAHIHLYNLYTDGAGNSELPRKIRLQTAPAPAAQDAKYKKSNWTMIVAALALVAAAGNGIYFLLRRPAAVPAQSSNTASAQLAVGTNAETLPQPPPASEPERSGVLKQPYTMTEYNAYQAVADIQDPALQIKELDDFVAKYPDSVLLVYVYPLYYQAYSKLKNYPKVIEYADKLLEFREQAAAAARYRAVFARSSAYNALITDPAQAKSAAIDTALASSAQHAIVDGLKILDELKKPDSLTEEAFTAQKKQNQMYLDGIAGQAATISKDYPAAIAFYKNALALNPDAAMESYHLGLAYAAMTPPQHLDAFWALARAVTAKNATPAQSATIKNYLRRLIQNYQQAGCDSFTEPELDALLQRSSSSTERPASYKLPGANDLSVARQTMTIASVITDLKAGGEKGKLTWLAACGMEFPRVPGKVLQVVPGADFVELKLALLVSEADFEAAAIPNMDVKVVGQPEAVRAERNSAIHFTGTLVSYDADPAFLLHWDKAKLKE